MTVPPQATAGLGKLYQEALSGIGSLFPQKVKQGFQSGIELMSPQARRELRDEAGNPILSSVSNYSTLSPGFKKELASVKGITLNETPQEFLGAYAARFLTDVGSDSTRHLYWRYNHPLAIADSLIKKAAGPVYKELDPTRRATLGLAAAVPAALSLGVLDITNPGEAFRPKGFAQNYAEEGSEDRRETTQPGLDFLERVFLGRQGRPLKYETAKQEIPDLTPQRYANYMNTMYQDKGLIGLGLLKFTPENLQGEPEARIAGFPVGLQAVGSLVGGGAALRSALKSSPPIVREMKGSQEIVRRMPGATRKVAGITLAGSLAGALVGNLANRAIEAARNNPEKLPSTYEYQQNV